MVFDDPSPLVVNQEASSSTRTDPIVAQDSAVGSSVEMSREGSPAFEEIRHPDDVTPPASNSPPSNVAAPSSPPSGIPAIKDNDHDEDFVDETILERIEALSEMFPKWLRNGVWSLTVNTKSSVKWCYSVGRTTAWVVCSTAAILVMPVLFEIERSTVEEQQKQQQRQILLGPGHGMAGGPPMMGPPPPIPNPEHPDD